MGLNVGFTGTRKPLTEWQMKGLEYLCKLLPITRVIHGGCIGADEFFHKLCRRNFPDLSINVHPSNLGKYQMEIDKQATYYTPTSPLQRNKTITFFSDILIACPAQENEILRSGTWSTIRYMKKIHKPVFIVTPRGDIHMDLPAGVKMNEITDKK